MNKKFAKRGFILLIVSFVLCISGGIASAYEEGLNKLTLSIDVSVGNDSNIIATNDAIDDSFVSIIPGIVVTLPRERSFFYLAYALRNDSYIDNDEYNNTSHNLDFLSRFLLGESYTFELKDRFIDALYGLWRDDSDSLGGEGYFTNDLNPVLKYESLSGMFAANVGFSYMIQRWDELNDRDWDQTMLQAYVGLGLGTFTRIGLTGRYTSKDYDAILTDYDGYFAGIQFDYSMPQTFDILARVGVESRDYKDIDETPSLTSFEVMFNKIFSEITSAKLGFSYQLADSEAYFGDYYTSLGVNLNLSYLFQERVQFFLRGQYADNQYEFSDREDTLTRAYVGAGYKFLDYLALQLFYNYSVRDSNHPEYDIDDARIELHLNFLKDFLF